eukprot:6891677-Alexandrium_andersonii.AAC.1
MGVVWCARSTSGSLGANCTVAWQPHGSRSANPTSLMRWSGGGSRLVASVPRSRSRNWAAT